jgi:hypothetical protein
MNELDLMLNEARDCINPSIKSVTYLGDAVYSCFDGYQLWLFTTTGVSITNTIALEPGVYHSLVGFALTLSENFAIAFKVNEGG